MTDALATYYGAPAGSGEPDGAGFKRSDHRQRRRLLVHGGVLTTHALPTSSSPIHRGKLVRERLLCQEMPPAAALARHLAAARRPHPQHPRALHPALRRPDLRRLPHRIDPIGFGFEHYDAVGRYRTMDGAHAVDASGEVLLTDKTNGSYDGVDELAQLLAGSPDVEACYALQWARFAVGSAENSELQCVQSELGAAFTEAEGRLDSLVLALVDTRFFRERGGAPASEPETSGESGGESSSAGEATSDPGTGADESSTGGDQPGPSTSPGLDVGVVQDSKWDAGECNTVTVTNSTDAPITWQVVLELQGTIQNAWNAKYAQMDTTFVWTGEPYNAEVAGKASVSFGFCLNY
jgi:hypothetical protein